MKRPVLLLILSIAALHASEWSKLTPDLISRIERAPTSFEIPVIIYPSIPAHYRSQKEMAKGNNGEYVRILRKISSSTQEPILSYLRGLDQGVSRIRTFWVANVITLEATSSVILALSDRSDVDRIELQPENFILRNKAYQGKSPLSPTPEWNIEKIKADSVWGMGYTGEGVLIGQIDTGVDTSHPALVEKWTGYWLDAVNGEANPYDDNGHGTHVMGIILGGDGPGPFEYDIGVAPGATFTAAKAFNAAGSGSTSDILDSYEWYASLVGDSSLPVRIINNSWGSNSSYTTVFWSATETWRDLGIVPVFAIGNSGPGQATAEAPGNYPIVIGVGATSQSDGIWHSSSRGPAPNTSPWNNQSYWCRGDWNFTKPDIAAPGNGILSSIPGGGYTYLSGTSMASPHIAGVVALLLSANPDLEFCEIYNLILSTADEPPIGAPYPNNNYGWGRVNAYALILGLTGPVVLMVSYQVETPDSSLDPGDTAEIIVTLTNISDSVAQGTEATLRSTSEYVTVLDSFFVFGDIGKTDTLSNQNSPFTIQVMGDTPQGSDIPLVLHVDANEGNYETEFSLLLHIKANRVDYADLITEKAILTITDRGGIGTFGVEGPGSGFVYPLSEALNTLYYASFGASNGTEAYTVDAFYSHDPYNPDEDWMNTTDPDGRITFVDPVVGDVMAWAKFDDSKHPVEQRGLNVTQVAYGFRNEEWGDFVVLQYKVKNEGDSAIDSLYLGIFSDFDIQPYDLNMADTDPARMLAYTWNPEIEDAPYVGLALTYPDSLANLSVLDNPTYVYPGIEEEEKAQFLSGQLNYPDGLQLSDWTVVVSAGPFYLSPGDSQFVIFGYVGGEDSLSLFEHTDSLRDVARSPVHVEDPGEGVSERSLSGSPQGMWLHVSPSITGRRVLITYSLKEKVNGKIAIYDLLGRRIATLKEGVLERGIEGINWDGKTESGKLVRDGVYFVRLETQENSRTAKILLIR